MDTMALRRLQQIAECQHATFTVDQALGVGFSARELAGMSSRGIVRRVVTGVYRFPGSPRSYQQRVTVACAAFNAVASHRTAAVLYGFVAVKYRGLEVSVPGAIPRRMPGIVVHADRPVTDDNRRVVDAVGCTAPGRTLLDLAAVVRPAIPRSAMEEALRRKLVTVAELTTLAGHARGRGRNGVVAFRTTVEKCVRFDVTDSELETMFEQLLEDHGLPRAERHLNVPGIGELDFAYPDRKLAFETDGWGEHYRPEQWERDAEKMMRARLRGWDVHRLTYRMVRRPNAGRTVARLLGVA